MVSHTLIGSTFKIIFGYSFFFLVLVILNGKIFLQNDILQGFTRSLHCLEPAWLPHHNIPRQFAKTERPEDLWIADPLSFTAYFVFLSKSVIWGEFINRFSSKGSKLSHFPRSLLISFLSPPKRHSFPASPPSNFFSSHLYYHHYSNEQVFFDQFFSEKLSLLVCMKKFSKIYLTSCHFQKLA